MSSPPGSAEMIAPAHYRSQLDTLVSLLQMANSMPEMADTLLLHEMIGSLQSGAADAGFPGVGDLLRNWKAGLQDIIRSGHQLSSDELLQMTIWFMSLQEHAAGRLATHGREMLAQLPEGIRWLPRLSPAVVRVMLRKLESTLPPAPAIAHDIEHDIEHHIETTAPSSGAFDAQRFVLGVDAEQARPDNIGDSAWSGTPSLSLDDRYASRAVPAANLDITPALLAQLPPEFLAAFPPGALDDLPLDVIEALLLETTHRENDLDTSPLADDDGAFAIDNSEAVSVDAAAIAADPGVTFGDIGDIDGADDAATHTATISEAAAPSFDSEETLAFAMNEAFADANDDTAHSNAEAVANESLCNSAPIANDAAPNAAFSSIDPTLRTKTTEETAFAFGDAIGLDSTLSDGMLFDGMLSNSMLSNSMQSNDTVSDNTPAADAQSECVASSPSVPQLAEPTTVESVTMAAPTVETFAAEPMPTASIWIGQEELELTQHAILEQLMPLAQAWAETPDADANAAIVDELAYQCRLVVNVMELIGTTTLAQGMETVRIGVEARDPAITPEAVATWCSVLLATIESPNAESAELLAIAAHDVPGLDDAWQAALIEEFSRVRIGMDPALLAERKTIATLNDIGLTPADDVVPSVLEGMLSELPGNAIRLGASVRAIADTGSFESIDEARRIAHTLKGDANTVGVRGLANLTHALEDILIALAKRPELLNAECADLLTNASDTVEEIADHLLGRGPAPESLLDTYQHVLDTANALADGADAVPAAAKSADPGARTHDRAPAASESAGGETIGATPQTAPRSDAEVLQTGMAASGIQSLNVPSALLDDLQRLAGESLVTANQIDKQLDGLTRLHRDQRQEVRYTQELVNRLDDLVALRGAALQSTAQKAGAELDPLEIDQYNELHVISRQLIEAHADSSEFVRRIEQTMNSLADLRSEQEKLNVELQRNIQRTRTVPFSQISARLQRIVRQTSKQVMKPVELELIGESIPLDAELLERVVEPLAHLLRNAIDHGIEAPERRRDAGKAEQGRITMRIGLQGDAAIIDIQDDGAGLDFDTIRSRAIAVGLLAETQDADDRLLTRLILLPGFSTRTSATEVSGRGIGMDVVNQRIAALRGVMTITSQHGVGMRVSLRLPVTQTLANVIVARGQYQVSAVVSASVERVISFAQGECVYDAQDGRLWVMLDGERVPALPLEYFYGVSADLRMWLDAAGVGLEVRNSDGGVTIVLVQSIDEVRSTVVKPIAAYLPPIPAVRGITQLGDGGLAPVIDLDVMLRSAQERELGIGALSISTEVPSIRVVVADDSLSVRRALEQLMQDAGFEVETARDGFEALAAIQAKPTHALLVDLEMPRMNGLEVTRNLRTHAETRGLPVVMITSRTTDKHQTMAEQAGVTRMLSKPFSEDSLVALVRGLIAESAAARDA